MVTLFEHLNREDAETFSLVLSASGIGHRMVGTRTRFRIDVPESLADAALTAIHRYQAENPRRPKAPVIHRQRPAPLPLSGIFVALALLTVHLAVTGSQVPEDYHRVFGADARLILNGAYYRCVTALMLHADATHIAANMAGIALFGSAVCTIAGTGVGWLMILASGIFGNLMNAWAYQQNHLSIGASTAIFGALGILCGSRVVDAIRTGRGWKQVALISGAGFALLAVLGSSARSDLGAHLFGWLSGVCFGCVREMLFHLPPGNKWQLACGMVAVLIPLGAWLQGGAG